MAEQMTDQVKAENLERVAKLIEDNLGYKVERKKVYQTNEHIGRLDLAGLSRGFNAYIYLKDEEEGGYRFRTVHTGAVRVVVTNGESYRGAKFKKWSMLHTLDFDKGAADKKTKAFLDKVKDLVETVTATVERHKASTDKAQRDSEYMAEWAEHGTPEGFTLVDSWNGKYLIPIEEGEPAAYYIKVAVVTDRRAEELGDQVHIQLGKVEFPNQSRIAGDKVNEFMRLYRQLYEFVKSCER